MRVIHAFLPLAALRHRGTGFIVAEVPVGVLRVTVARGPVTLSRNFHRVETVTREIRMDLHESAGIHDPDRDALPRVAKRVGG